MSNDTPDGVSGAGRPSRAVWRMPKAGSLEALRLEHEALAAPAPGEVRIAVRTVGLNMADVFACLGLFPTLPMSGASSRSRKRRPQCAG